MKSALIAIGEMMAIFIAAILGFVQNPFHVEKVLSQSAGSVRVMVFDWILAAGIAWLVLVLAELSLRRMKSAWMRPTLCFFVVLALGFVTRLGLKTMDVGFIRF